MQNPSTLPMKPEYLKLNDDEILLADNKIYRQTMGALIYLETVAYKSTATKIFSHRKENPKENI